MEIYVIDDGNVLNFIRDPLFSSFLPVIPSEVRKLLLHIFFHHLFKIGIYILAKKLYRLIIDISCLRSHQF